MTLQLRTYQRDSIDAVYNYWSEHDGSPLIVLPTGCHAPGTEILMFDGTTKPVEFVSANDNVMGPDSKPRNVLRVFSGNEMMYRVTPAKGESFVVNESHVFSLKTTNEGKKYERFPNCTVKAGTIENIKLSDYQTKAKYWKHLRKLWRTGVDFANDNAPLPIPAWILGAMLGDGTLCRSACITNMDPEILDPICDYIESLGLTMRFVQKPNNKAWGVYFTNDPPTKGKRNIFIAKLKEAGAWGLGCEDKFIPNRYKTGSKETRLDVLAGILDTDGHLSRSGFDYISKSKRLADDVVFIARSLSMAAYCRPCEKRDQNGRGGTYWRVSISGNTDVIPVRVSRKKAPLRRQIKNPLVTGFRIEPIGVGSFYGFELDGDHLYLTGDFTVHHNSGKSLVIANLINELITNYSDMRILIATHVSDLIAQNFSELVGIWPLAPAGLYSAGLGRRDAHAQIIFGGIQTIANKAARIGHIDLVIVDEAHTVPRDAETQYGKLLNGLREINPDLKLLGLTATPYRMGEGLLHQGEGAMFDAIAYEKPVSEMIEEGYLCRPISKGMTTHYDLTGVGKQAGDYKQGALQTAVDRSEVNSAVATEIVAYGANRRSWLLFCSGVDHAYHMRDELRARGITCETVVGDTPNRSKILADFKAGKVRAVTNNSVMTTGVNIPGIDLLAMCRPTMSAALYIQMIGRGLRLAPGKSDCLVLDFAGVVRKHGPIDIVTPSAPKTGTGEAPVKECPQELGGCGSLVHASVKNCPDCGYAFPEPEEPKISKTAEDVPILSKDEATWRKVVSRQFRFHEGKGEKPPSVKTTYTIGMSPYDEWLCPEHNGYARTKAQRWWTIHGGQRPFPQTVLEWLERQNELNATDEISVVPDGRYWRVVGHRPSLIPANDNKLPAASEELSAAKDNMSDLDRELEEMGDVPF